MSPSTRLHGRFASPLEAAEAIRALRAMGFRVSARMPVRYPEVVAALGRGRWLEALATVTARLARRGARPGAGVVVTVPAGDPIVAAHLLSVHGATAVDPA